MEKLNLKEKATILLCLESFMQNIKSSIDENRICDKNDILNNHIKELKEIKAKILWDIL